MEASQRVGPNGGGRRFGYPAECVERRVEVGIAELAERSARLERESRGKERLRLFNGMRPPGEQFRKVEKLSVSESAP